MSTDNHPLTQSKDDPTDATTIGVKLQQLREQKGIEIQQASKETRISTSNLLAIEGEIYDQLPADTFVRGLITIYGNFLGIDGREAARSFLQERDRQQPKGKKSRWGKSGHSLTPKKLAEPSQLSSATIAGILLLIIVISFTAVCLYTGWNPFVPFLSQDQSSPPTKLSSGIRDLGFNTTTTQQISSPEPALPRLQENSKQNSGNTASVLPQSEQSFGGD